MWRRVLSQSPLTVANDLASSTQTQKYLDGWKALGALLHSGRSLSGGERNCAFLNTGQPRFADVSSVFNLDHRSDSRGFAQLDWDGDGDLDIWMTNRTAPRIRFLQNDVESQNHWLRLKLRGTKCNPDAIGARVELFLDNPQSTRLVRSVSAGEGFLSQTTKTVHFGLGTSDSIKRLVVRWPGGDTEEFDGVTANGSFRLQEGRGIAEPFEDPTRSTPQLEREVTLAKPSPFRRIALSRPIPLPTLSYVDSENGQSTQWKQTLDRPTLISLWATWCPSCEAELNEWKSELDAKHEFDFDILSLNVDQADGSSTIESDTIVEKWRNYGFELPLGLIDGETFESFEIVDRSLLLHQAALPIPISFLVDAQGDLAVIYKGPISLKLVQSDVDLLQRGFDDVRDMSTPLAGKWYSEPFPADLIGVPSQLLGLGRGQQAFEYLNANVFKKTAKADSNTWNDLGVTPEKYLQTLNGTAQLLAKEKRIEDLIVVLRQAIDIDTRNWRLHVQLSSLMIQQKQWQDAIQLNQQMTKLRQGHPLPYTNLAWILAVSDDPTVRDPKKAIDIAERVCESTNNQEPSALDALAVAYAADGRFSDAVNAAEKAIARSIALKRPDLEAVIRKRLAEFKAQQKH